MLRTAIIRSSSLLNGMTRYAKPSSAFPAAGVASSVHRSFASSSKYENFEQLSPRILPQVRPTTGKREVWWDFKSNFLLRKENDKAAPQTYIFAEGHGHQKGEHYQDLGKVLQCMGNVGEMHLVFVHDSCWTPPDKKGERKLDPNVKCKPSKWNAVVITLLLDFEEEKHTQPGGKSDVLVDYFIKQVQDQLKSPGRTSIFNNRYIVDAYQAGGHHKRTKDGKYLDLSALTYKGSLTTRPFTGNTEFFIIEYPLVVSKETRSKVMRKLDDSDNQGEVLGCSGEVLEREEVEPSAKEQRRVPLFEPPSTILVKDSTTPAVEIGHVFVGIPN